MKIRKTTEKIAVNVGDLVIKISPLTFEQKCDIQVVLSAGTTTAILKASKLAMKCAIKEISGLENPDGSPYEVTFDEIGLSDDVINDLGNSEIGDNLNYMCISLLNGLPKQFENPVTKKPLDGVSFVDEAVTEKK
jgi:hypothetical protein